MNKGRSRYYLVDVCAPRRTGHQICAAEKNCRHNCISIFYFSIYFSISLSFLVFLFSLRCDVLEGDSARGIRILQRVSLLVTCFSLLVMKYLFWHHGHGSNALVCMYTHRLAHPQQRQTQGFAFPASVIPNERCG